MGEIRHQELPESAFADNRVEEDVDVLDEADEVIPYTHSITFYGADCPVDSLVKQLDRGDIIVPAFDWVSEEDSRIVGFQREYVWPKPKADKFIESLLLGLPVPGIFLVREASGRLLVLDGHQRLHTLHRYYKGLINGREYRLENVQERFVGMRFTDLDIEDRRRLDDSIIHATVVRQDEPSQDQSSIYMIFERLNAGGVNLQPQEIRVALYHGQLVQVLKSLNEERAWRELYGKKSRRLKDMEMILRFFAFYYCSDQYRSPMKDFLNRYMAENRNLDRQSEAELRQVFCKTTSVLNSILGRRAFRPKRAVNAAVVDSLMTGVAKRLRSGEIGDAEHFLRRYRSLLSSQEYLAATEKGTSQEANVRTRMKLAKDIFVDVK